MIEARIFRVDNMKRKDLTPANPVVQKFELRRKGSSLTVTGVGNKLKWHNSRSL